MKGKILLVVGFGVGYVLGTKAGRERYEQIKTAADKVWQSPPVQQGVHQAQDWAQGVIPDLTEKLLDATKKLVQTMRGAEAPAKAPAAKRAAASTASGTAAKTGAAKTGAAKTGTSTTKAATTKAGGSTAKPSTTKRAASSTRSSASRSTSTRSTSGSADS